MPSDIDQHRRMAERALTEALVPVRTALLTLAGYPLDPPQDTEKNAVPVEGPTALDHLCQSVSLTRFEQDVLLLCVGIQVDPMMRDALQHLMPEGSPGVRPTVELTLNICREPDWHAFAPAGSLRGADLLRLPPNPSHLNAEVIVDEALVHLLAGFSYWDEQLAPLLRLGPAAPLAGHDDELADLRSALAAVPPVIAWLRAPHPGLAVRLAALAASPGDNFIVNAGALPVDAAEARRLGIRFRRLLRILNATGTVDLASAVSGPARVFIEAAGAPLVVLETEQEKSPGLARPELVAIAQPCVVIDLPPTDAHIRGALWRDAMATGGQASPDWVQSLATALGEEFDLAPELIDGLSGFARATAASGAEPAAVARRLRRRCQTVSRHRLEQLAERVPVFGGLADVLLPDEASRVLAAIGDHMTSRMIVHRDWQFDRISSNRSLGVTALFSGPSGTGKTLAAQKLAAELDLDLYRIDLSQTVSKWIGESEKNLREIFTAAAVGGAILLFDEADTLFAKRTDGGDAGSHFTNAVVGFLLQEMERYRGLAILTTNRRNAIDDAFLRRIRYLVEFPFPTGEDRLRLWQAALPATVPQDRLDLPALAGLPLSGGQIANVVLVAAGRAAAARRKLAMDDLTFALRLDFAKNGVSEALLSTGALR